MTSRSILGLAIALLVAMPAPAGAVDGIPPTRLDDCNTLTPVDQGIYVRRFESTETTGGLAGIPDRVNADVEPGQQTRICIGFQNRTGSTIDLEFGKEDVGASRAGLPTTVGGDYDYGAAQWLTLPPRPRATLKHGDLVWIEVQVDVPLDTSGGSNYAAVTASPVNPSEAKDVQTRIVPSIAVQVFLDVPGDLDRGGEIVDVRSPRVIWWDGLGIGDIGPLDKLRGMEIAPIRFDWKNSGSFTERVGGSVVLESSLGGKDVEELKVAELVVLRSSTRAFEVTWSEDIPLVGRFTPTIRVTGPDGEVVTEKLDPIWVIPSWWYILALVVAIALPLWWRRRSRRRFDELVARVEAAEARAGDGDDWDDGDEWSR